MPALSATSTSACARSSVISRGFSSSTCLPACGGAPRQLQMRVRRRQHHHRVDAVVREDGVDVGGYGKTPTRGEGGTPRFGRAVGGRDLDAVGKVEQALRVRGDRHAEADDGDALARIPIRSNASIVAAPFSRKASRCAATSATRSSRWLSPEAKPARSKTASTSSRSGAGQAVSAPSGSSSGSVKCSAGKVAPRAAQAAIHAATTSARWPAAAPSREALERGGDDALRQFLAAVIGDLRCAVGQRRIGEAFGQFADVVLRIEAGIGRQGRDGLAHSRVDEAAGSPDRRRRPPRSRGR